MTSQEMWARGRMALGVRTSGPSAYLMPIALAAKAH